jgi:tetratricopeptide (TPR) repeat protein
MRQKLLFILVFSFWLIPRADGQTIAQTYHFAEQQYVQANYKAALADLQRVVFFDSDNHYTDVYLKIARSFYYLEDYPQAIKNYEVAYRFENSDSIKAEILFGKAMCYLKQEKYLLSLNELFTIPENTTLYFNDKRDLYLAITYFGLEDFDNSLGYFCKLLPSKGDSLMIELFHEFGKYRKRFDPDKVQTMSIFIPGLGQVYCGSLGSGLNSMILLGGIAVASVYIWQAYGIFDALMTLSSWYYRYYSGGFRNAKLIATDKILHKREEVYRQILSTVSTYLE